MAAIVNCCSQLKPFLSYVRNASTLVVAEHDNSKLSPVTLNAITAATAVGGDITCLVAGAKCQVKKVSFLNKKVKYHDYFWV